MNINRLSGGDLSTAKIFTECREALTKFRGYKSQQVLEALF